MAPRREYRSEPGWRDGGPPSCWGRPVCFLPDHYGHPRAGHRRQAALARYRVGPGQRMVLVQSTDLFREGERLASAARHPTAPTPGLAVARPGPRPGPLPGPVPSRWRAPGALVRSLTAPLRRATGTSTSIGSTSIGSISIRSTGSGRARSGRPRSGHPGGVPPGKGGAGARR